MRAFPGVLCATFLATSMLLVAEQSSPSVHPHKASRLRKAHTASKSSSLKHATDRPLYSAQAPANGVVIYNGNQRQTRVFNSTTDPAAPVQNLPPAVVAIVTADSKSHSSRPVVMGVPSNAPNAAPVVLNIASSGSNHESVVVDVASGGFQAAGAVQASGISVSPRPAKRPPYRPAALDRQ